MWWQEWRRCKWLNIGLLKPVEGHWLKLEENGNAWDIKPGREPCQVGGGEDDAFVMFTWG